MEPYHGPGTCGPGARELSKSFPTSSLKDCTVYWGKTDTRPTSSPEHICLDGVSKIIIFRELSQSCHRCWQEIQESKRILSLIRLNWTDVPLNDIQLGYWFFNSSSIKHIVTQTHLMCEKDTLPPRKQVKIWQSNKLTAKCSFSQIIKI